MLWVCPSCDLEFQPADHDLARCRWAKESEVKIFEYALFRAAGEMMTADELAVSIELARMAEQGDREAYRRLRIRCAEAIRRKKLEAAAAA